MSNEVPPREVLEAQIALLNSELHRIATLGAVQKQPFQHTEDGEVTMPPDCSFPGFWNHYLCGATIGQVNFLISEAQYKNIPVDATTVKSYQNKALSLINHWIEDPSRTKTILEQETCIATQTVCQAFIWSDNYPLYQQFGDAMLKLGNTYSMLISGKKLIGSD